MSGERKWRISGVGSSLRKSDLVRDSCGGRCLILVMEYDEFRTGMVSFENLSREENSDEAVEEEERW